MLRETNFPVGPAEILLILRERASITEEDLFQQLCERHPDARENLPRYQRAVNHFLMTFEAVEFITRSESSIQVDRKRIEKTQRALDVSLVELAKAGPGAIVASPRFRSKDEFGGEVDVFVATPFAPAWDPICERIKSAADELGMSAKRADDIFSSTEGIIDKVWALMRSAKVTVADCTGQNANVFYEIGMSHTLGRPTVLLTQEISEVPFDLRHIDCVCYSRHDLNGAQNSIRDAIAAAMNLKRA